MLGYWLGQVDAIANHIELAIVAVVAVSLLPAVVEVVKHRRAARRTAER
jgi:membrane-associated protein